MPSAMGYVNVGVFLAVLEVTQARLILRVRPRVAQAIFGIESLVSIQQQATDGDRQPAQTWPYKGSLETSWAVECSRIIVQPTPKRCLECLIRLQDRRVAPVGVQIQGLGPVCVVKHT